MRIVLSSEQQAFIRKHGKATGLSPTLVVRKALAFYKVMAPAIEKKVEETGKKPS